MQKPAVTDKDLHPLIKNRWSPRSFDVRSVETVKLQRLFEAARWAPSSFNEQPWRFVAGEKGDETWQKIFDSLNDWNQQWAAQAPVLVLTLGSARHAKNNKENATFKYDVGQAVACLTVQASADGLVVHQMGGFSKQKTVEHFDIPEDFVPLTISAIGYQAAPENLPADFETLERSPRSRKPLEELVYSGRFGQSITLTG